MPSGKWTGCCCTCIEEGAHTERLTGTGSGVGLQLSGMEPRERTCRGPETGWGWSMLGVLGPQQEAREWRGEGNRGGRSPEGQSSVPRVMRSRWVSVWNTWVLGHSSPCSVAIFFLYGGGIADPLLPLTSCKSKSV